MMRVHLLAIQDWKFRSSYFALNVPLDSSKVAKKFSHYIKTVPCLGLNS